MSASTYSKSAGAFSAVKSSVARKRIGAEDDIKAIRARTASGSGAPPPPRTAKIEDDIVPAHVGQPERKDVARDGRCRIRRRLAHVAVGRLARVVAARELTGRPVSRVDEYALECGDLGARDRRRPHALELLGGARSELKVDHFPRPHHAVVPGLRRAKEALEGAVTKRVCEGEKGGREYNGTWRRSKDGHRCSNATAAAE